MARANIPNDIGKKEISAEIIAREAIKNPKLVPDIIQALSSDDATARFKSAKTLVLVSREKPELLYPHFDFFVKHLDNKNNILKWNAMDVIANLTPVDAVKKFDVLFRRFYDLLYEGSLITAGHVVSGSAVITKAKPYLEEKITEEILKIEKIPLPTEECRNILKGQAIKALERYFDQIESKDKVVGFVEKEINNARQATRERAEKFLKKWGKS